MKILASWKSGVGIFHADAQTVAEEILSIGDEASAAQILDKARDEATELHKCFEWDDSAAAEKYRLVQARNITANLVIRRTEEEVMEDKPEIRLFHKTESSSGYKPIQVIVKNEDEYANLLKRAYAELHSFKVKYQNLKELDYILELIP